MLNSVELIGTVLNMAAEAAADEESPKDRSGWLRRLFGRRD
jgi:hypothetical protein